VVNVDLYHNTIGANKLSSSINHIDDAISRSYEGDWLFQWELLTIPHIFDMQIAIKSGARNNA